MRRDPVADWGAATKAVIDWSPARPPARPPGWRHRHSTRISRLVISRFGAWRHTHQQRSRSLIGSHRRPAPSLMNSGRGPVTSPQQESVTQLLRTPAYRKQIIPNAYSLLLLWLFSPPKLFATNDGFGWNYCMTRCDRTERSLMSLTQSSCWSPLYHFCWFFSQRFSLLQSMWIHGGRVRSFSR